MVVVGTPKGAAVDYALADEQPRPTRNRSPERLDQNAEIADWVVKNCQGVGLNEVARRLATEFPGVKESTRRQQLLKGPLAKLLKRDGKDDKTRWSRTK